MLVVFLVTGCSSSEEKAILLGTENYRTMNPKRDENQSKL